MLITSPLDEQATARADLAAATRRLQALVRGTRIDDAAARRLAGLLENAAAALVEAGHDDELGSIDSSPGLRGAGQALSPTYEVTSWNEQTLAGTLAFSRFHLGSEGNAHGGAVALWADDVLGRLANTLSAGRARTAYLRIDYRRPIPINVDVEFRAWVEASTGRKIELGVELTREGEPAAEGHGLWVAPKVNSSPHAEDYARRRPPTQVVRNGCVDSGR